MRCEVVADYVSQSGTAHSLTVGVETIGSYGQRGTTDVQSAFMQLLVIISLRFLPDNFSG